MNFSAHVASERHFSECGSRYPRPYIPTYPIKKAPIKWISEKVRMQGKNVTNVWFIVVNVCTYLPYELASQARNRSPAQGGGGLMHLRFFWNIFFVNRSIVTIFYIAFRPSFLRPPWKFQNPDP